MTVITASELSLLRSRPHRAEFHLSIYKPPTVFVAQINSTTLSKGSTAIPYDGVTRGVYTDIIGGISLYIGTTPGGKDIGRIEKGMD